MIAELYDKTLFVILLSTAWCAASLYPVLGPVATVGYLVWGYSFILLAVLDSQLNNKLIRFLYTASFLGVGYTALLTPLLVGLTLLNTLVFQYAGYNYASLTVYIAVGSATILSLYAVSKSYYVAVRQETIDLGLDTEYSVAHISDLHIGATLGARRLQNVAQTIEDIDPDFTVITGDIFDGSGWPNQATLQPLASIDDIYVSRGNHDYYFGGQALEQLHNIGATVLANEATKVQDIYLAGVDDIEYPNQIPSQEIDSLSDQSEQASILLYHRPDETEAFKDSTFNIMLSGHTHNGQIYPVKWLSSFSYKYLYGLHTFGEQYLNVTSGAGTGGPMMRLGTKNEVCLITIT